MRQRSCTTPGHRAAILDALGAVLLCAGASASAQGSDSATHALKKLTLEDLLNVEVTSVSRTSEQLHSAAAAVTVLSNEDIRRSGATSIPETLRLAPGMHVAQRNANAWAVSARGFSSVNSEKLLVLVDGRSLYTPLFSGVFWDVQDYFLGDIERIEAIRGPGAALWGSNAVNGVVNITTKHARDTQGTYLEAGFGTEEEVIAGARYGGEFGEDAFFRVFAKHAQRDATFKDGATNEDDWRLSRIGFRADKRVGEADELMLLGAAYRGEVGQYSPSIEIIGRPGPTGALRSDLSGGHALARWRRTLAADSDVQVRFYYDRTDRDDPSFIDELDTFDLDLQHRFQLGPFAGLASHDIVWGVNYRYTDNDNRGLGIFALAPARSADSVVSAFVQDQTPLTDTVRLTLGSKFEHNDFSGFEIQPSVRATWEAAPGLALWGAVSRAVRVPTRLERDIAIDVNDPASNPIIRLLGNEDFDAEELLAYELGARWQARTDLFLDLAAFHNRYEGLASFELGAPFVDPGDGRTVVPIVYRNLTDGESHGVELLATYAPLSSWRLIASYSYVDLNLDPRGQDLNRGEFYEGATPRHQFGLRSLLDLSERVQLDWRLRYVSDVRRSPDIVSGAGVDGYTELDVRLAWFATQELELSVVGQNLLHKRHIEFGAPAARGAIERGVYGKAVWRF